MKTDADIGIVGGGPIGLATAIFARLRGFEVVLWEPGDGPVDKACGEGLMPSAIAQLRSLGVQIPAGREFTGISYIDAERPELRAEGEFASPALGVRRLELSAALLDRAVDVGVEIRNRKVRHFDDRGDHVIVDDTTVRWLVGADGLHSKVRRDAGLDREDVSRRRFGVRRHYEMSPWSEHVEVYWKEGAEAYVTPVGPDQVGVAILFEPPGRFDDMLDDFPQLRDRLAGASTSSDDRGAGPFGARAESVKRGNVLLVGDAAGYVDALTGEGIAIGMASARALVDSLDHGSPDRYPTRYARATRAWRWSTRFLLAATRRRFLQRLIIRFLRYCPGVFDFVLRQIGGVDIVSDTDRGHRVPWNQTGSARRGVGEVPSRRPGS